LHKGLQEQAKKKTDFHSTFRAGDGSWVYDYDTGIKQHSSHWDSHPPAIQERRQMKSDFKSMLSVFLNIEAILQKEFFLQCQPVNQQFCIRVLRVLVEAVGRKCPTSGIHRTGCCIMTTCHAT